MTPADVPAMLELRIRTRENRVTLEQLERDYGVTAKSWAASLDDGRVAGWLAEEGGTLLGFAAGEAASGEVLVVAVHPGHEGRGVGREVLARVCTWLFGLGHASLWLRATPDASLRAYAFYRRLGWYSEQVLSADEEIMRLERDEAVGTATA